MVEKKRTVLLLAGMMLVMLSCTMPVLGSPNPTAVPTTTPDMTMTALFGSGILGSLTPAVGGEQTLVTLSPLTPTPTTTLEPTHTPTVTSTVTPLLSPTTTSTVTPPPTLTPGYTTVPQYGTRPGAHVMAAFFTYPPILDGDMSDWVTPQFSASTVTYGGGNWVNSADLSSVFRLGWDWNYLYVAARVWDDAYVQNASGYDIYKGDSLEILLDSKLTTDYYYNVLSADDYQLGISPGYSNIYGAKEAYLWFPGGIRGSRSGVQIGARALSDGYEVEAAIPWSVFELSPVAGGRYGFVFSVSDNDDSGSNIQQSLVSSASNRHLTLPMTWGELYLNP